MKGYAVRSMHDVTIQFYTEAHWDQARTHAEQLGGKVDEVLYMIQSYKPTNANFIKYPCKTEDCLGHEASHGSKYCYSCLLGFAKKDCIHEVTLLDRCIRCGTGEHTTKEINIIKWNTGDRGERRRMMSNILDQISAMICALDEPTYSRVVGYGEHGPEGDHETFMSYISKCGNMGESCLKEEVRYVLCAAIENAMDTCLLEQGQPMSQWWTMAMGSIGCLLGGTEHAGAALWFQHEANHEW